MTYSDKELQQIEQMASLYLPISDIAIVLGINPENLRRDIKVKGSPAEKAYTKGKVSSKVALRKQEMMLAKVGSPLALESVRRALMDMEDDEWAMGLPKIIDVCRVDLFTGEGELQQKYDAVTIARLLRVRDEYQWVLANPDLADRQFVEEFTGRTGLSDSAIYTDLAVIKQLLPALQASSRDFHRWKANQMLLETYQMAKKRKDTKTMERAASSYAKYNRVDVEDEQQMPFELIVVQPFTATADPSVLGIKPLPNIDQRIKDMIAKYRRESIDIEDVEAEEADLEENELWNAENNETDESDILQ